MKDGKNVKDTKLICKKTIILSCGFLNITKKYSLSSQRFCDIKIKIKTQA